MKKILFISGPTAVGKTKLSIELAIKFNLEIISADSIQIYKYFNIGSAKPTLDELNKVKHYLIDYVLPWEPYSNTNFIQDAKNSIDDIYKKNKHPLIVGGTGFYINSLIYGTFKTPSSEPALRKILEEKYAENKVNLYLDLKKIDPKTASKFHYNDKYRTIRALEVYYTSNKTLSDFREEHKNKQHYDYLIIFIKADNKIIKENIINRTKIMIENGLIDEVKSLLNNFKIKSSKPMQSIAYKELSLYLDKQISLDEAINMINNKTYQLAKRQITWFKKRANVIFVDQNKAYNTISSIVDNFYFK